MKLVIKIAFVLCVFCINLALYGNSSKLPENVSTAEVIVYPNPVNDGYVTLKSDQKIERVEIIDILGQVVQTEDINSAYSYKLNLELQSGIYLIKVIFKNNTYSTKRIRVN